MVTDDARWTAQQHHTLYCRCGGFNDMDVEAVTHINEIIQHRAVLVASVEAPAADLCKEK